MNDNTKAITVRIPETVYVWLVEQAKKERRSLNAQIVLVLEDAHAHRDAQTINPKG